MHLIEHAILFLILDENINLEHFPTGNNTIIVKNPRIKSKCRNFPNQWKTGEGMDIFIERIQEERIR